MTDYYKILEIKPNASAEGIKKAYRRLSKLYHPDINPRGAEQFKNINEANSILSDAEKRKLYDIKYKAAFSSSQNKNATKQPKPKANNTPNNTNVKTKVNTNTNSFTKTYTSYNGTQSTIIVNGVKINVTGNNTTTNIKVVNGKVIVETKNY
jgi:curved DNA-binding protein CbpA